MSIAAVFDKLGQKVMPKVMAKALPDLMDIVAKSGTSDGAGGLIKATTTDYSDVPCSYEPTTRYEQQVTANSVMTSFERYIVTFATHQTDGLRIDIDPTVHRLKVLARGDEPDKTFRIITIRDNSGVYFEAVCEKEN